MAAGVALLVGAISGLAGAQSGELEVIPSGNPKCADLGYANGFKIEASGEFPDAGPYTIAGPGVVETEGDAADFEVTISYASMDPFSISFNANTAVDAVFVKAGQGGHLYKYDPPAQSDSGLTSPTEDSISHITFCWDTPPNGTTTTTSTTTTTTTPGKTTTTTTVPGKTTTTVTTVPGKKPPVMTTTTAPTQRPSPGQARPAAPVAARPGFTG